MPEATMVMYEEEYQRIKAIIARLRADANAKMIFLIDKNGQQIAANGDINGLDTTSLASLTAGNVAATDGLARLIGEKEFPVLSHEGERDNLHITVVNGRVILVVIFDQRSSLGLVRLRVKRASVELSEVFDELMRKVEREKSSFNSGLNAPFAEITDEDIDRLFGEDGLGI
jgi:predicted regulator of Ras-like GTPase activity (Roadblock/LC7/MglB family)